MASEVHVKDAKKTVDVNASKEELRTGRLETEYWFTNPEVYKIPTAKQRKVILNPGTLVERTKVLIPGKGYTPINQMVYLPDLPINMRGQIIAVTGIKQGGSVKPKPIGEYYELFEDGSGHRIWTNPNEYRSEDKNGENKHKDSKKQIPSHAAKRGYSIADVESGREVFGRFKAGRNKQNSQVTGTKGKS